VVPLCREHHRELHHSGNELAWWHEMGIDPLPAARDLWERSHKHRNGHASSGSRQGNALAGHDANS
jgi:hypothetical protein